MQAHLAADCPDRETCWAKDIHDKHACTCTPYSAGGDGPEIDCPKHGVMCVCGRRLGVHEAPAEFEWTDRHTQDFGLLVVVEGCVLDG
jgi:hypothetical protein